MLKRTLAAAALCLVGAASIVSAQDFGHDREAAMKKNGAAMGALAAIAKGEKDYDAEVVKTALTNIKEGITVFPTYFPPGSEKASEEASPKIWENKADFEAKAAKLAEDVDALLAQMPADKAAVGAAMQTLGKNCGGCHELYRLKKS